MNLEEEGRLAVKAWNMMGGEINWTALPVICEILGVQDVEKFLLLLAVVKERKRNSV